jgi:prephenate dehydrogenase
VIDDATTDPEEAVAGADVVLLAVPVRSMAALARRIGHALKPGAIVTDAGSTKEIVMGELFALLPPHAKIVPAHPIAGSERTGAAAARPDLFRGRRTIITPNGIADADAIALVRRLWEAAGAKVEMMDAHTHDLVVGAVSHLPHLVAYALVETVLRWDEETPMLRFSAGGLRDFTRVAGSSPEMWTDICADNPGPIVEAIDRFIRALTELRGLVDGGRAEALREWFERSREARKRIVGENG